RVIEGRCFKMRRLLPILLLLSCAAFAQLPDVPGSVGAYQLGSYWKNSTTHNVLTCTPGSADCISVILGDAYDTTSGAATFGNCLVSYANHGSYRNTKF